MLLCLGDRGVGSAVRAEAMTARVERRFEDRLQDLEHRLLNDPIHHIRNAKPPLPTTRLRQPDPANITGLIAFGQQSVAQRGEKRRSIVLRFLDRPVRPLPVPPCCVLP
jgi:hypothetical protein